MTEQEALARALEVNARLKHTQYFAQTKQETETSWCIVIVDTIRLSDQHEAGLKQTKQ